MNENELFSIIRFEILSNVRYGFECVHCSRKLSEEERKEPVGDWSSTFLITQNFKNPDELIKFVNEHKEHPDFMFLPYGEDIDKLIDNGILKQLLEECEELCSSCNGSGVQHETQTKCVFCDGKGINNYAERCGNCNGSGSVK